MRNVVPKPVSLTLLTDTSYDNPDWSPENAQKYVTDQLGKINPDEIKGVYAANDGQAGGVIAALKGAGIAANALPPVTGQDAELAAIQRIIAGEQYSTIYKDTRQLAEVTIQMAQAMLNGQTPETNNTTDYDNGEKVVPAYLLQPEIVYKDNYEKLLVEGGYYTEDQLK